MIRRTMRAAAGLASSLTLLVLLAPSAAAATPPLPDPRAGGIIGLCDRNLKPISSGSTATTPFVWRAVGATAAAGPYAEKNGTATLYAYQPRPQVPASEWSGLQLASSGHYSNTKYPMEQATGADTSLADYITEFPPLVNGLIELRLYLGGPGLPLRQTSYDATFIKVTGSTWTVVYGGTVSCTNGTAFSRETVVLPSTVVNPPPPRPSSGTSSTSSSTTAPGSTTSGSNDVTAPLTSGAARQGKPAASSHSSSSSTGTWVGVGIGILAIVALGGLAVRRRWGPTTNNSTPSDN